MIMLFEGSFDTGQCLLMSQLKRLCDDSTYLLDTEINAWARFQGLLAYGLISSRRAPDALHP